MNPTLVAVRAGLARGWIELRQTFTNAQDMGGHLFLTVLLVGVMLFFRGKSVPGTDFSLSAMMLPSVLGASVVINGLSSMAMLLAIEREDGTLLRAKAVPNGMLGYLIGKIVLTVGVSVMSLVFVLVPGLFVLEGLVLDAGSWLTLAWVLVLGLAATMPIGAVFGSLFKNPRNAAVIMPVFLGLVAMSGIFYPVTSFPQWLQWIAQVFPVYWLGLGMRSAMLPDDLAAVEIGGSWRHLEMVGVLGAWAVVGLVVAPIVLRRMARRESGSVVAARREQALQRVT